MSVNRVRVRETPKNIFTFTLHDHGHEKRSFGHVTFDILNLFRISIFGFRIWITGCPNAVSRDRVSDRP